MQPNFYLQPSAFRLPFGSYSKCYLFANSQSRLFLVEECLNLSNIRVFYCHCLFIQRNNNAAEDIPCAQKLCDIFSLWLIKYLFPCAKLLKTAVIYYSYLIPHNKCLLKVMGNEQCCYRISFMNNEEVCPEFFPDLIIKG